MRTRSRSITVVESGGGNLRYRQSGYYDTAKPPQIHWQGDVLLYDERVEMPYANTTWEAIYDQEPKLTEAVNNVTHKRLHRWSFPFADELRLVYPSPVRQNYRCHGVYGEYPLYSWDSFTPDWSNLVANFYSQADPRGPVGLRLFQNAMEYAETINLFRGLFKLVSKADKILARSFRSRAAADIAHLNPGKLSAKDVGMRIRKGRLEIANSPSTITSIADHVTGSWLTTRYGVQPLVGDLWALADMHDRITEQYCTAVRRSQLADTIHTRKSKTSEISLPLYAHLGESVSYKRSETYTISGQVTYPNIRPGSQLWDDISRRYLGLDSILTNLWEVIPLSFVVDWFVDVGGFLSRNPSLKLYQDSEMYNVQLRNVCHSVKAVLQPKVAIIGSNSRVFWGLNFGSDYPASVPKTFDLSACESSTYYQRIRGLPAAYEEPELLTGLSLTHLADGAAILYSRLK